MFVPRIGSAAVHDMGTLVSRTHPEWEVDSEVKVPLVRLDDMIAPDEHTVSFIKCDVEGHELAVLRGAAQTLKSGPPLLIEVEQRHHDTPLEEVFGHLLDLGEVYAVSTAVSLRSSTRPDGSSAGEELVDRQRAAGIHQGLSGAAARQGSRGACGSPVHRFEA